MPFQMKVQPIDAKRAVDFAPRSDPARPAAKSRLKRLFERQFSRPSSAEKLASAGDGREKEREEGGDVEPSSVCLDTMVLGFMEEGHHERPPRGRCICFNANFDDISDDDCDARDADAPGSGAPPGDAAEAIKGLVPCASVVERNLLADASKILEKAKNSKNKDVYRRTVSDGLRSLGYDAAICKSRWDKNPSFPAGEYEYIDVVIDGGLRLLVDVDFKSEFEVARPTKSYRAVLQHLPSVFVGRPDRLQRIVALASEAARQSLKKKGLHVPPWRRPEYMRAKWLSPHQRMTAMDEAKEESVSEGAKSSYGSGIVPRSISAVNFSSEFNDSGVTEAAGNDSGAAAAAEERIKVVVSPWQPPPARPKSGAKIIAGLALVL
ncbi:hypothetical protein Cni_G00464 [Canna indica]|uniref:Uncharacterized protein n=1 Tax=Canna indica TaxID=4628 RepID=A0AAQ3JL48_9LILI|nr:hypothetical protein Cni_G00464 [Canna indica]